MIAALGQQLASGSTNGKLAAAKRLEQIGAPAVPCLIHALASTDPEVQLLALRALTRHNGLPEQALPKVAALSNHSDPRLALRARLAVYLAAPLERSRLFPELFAALETAGDDLAIEALLAMYRADPDRRLAILGSLIERMGREQAIFTNQLSQSTDYANQIADLGWEVIPQLDAIYPQASSEARWLSVVVLMKLISRDRPVAVVISHGNQVQRWEIPEQAQPLLARALADPDPRIKEMAELVGQHDGSGYLGPNYGGGGISGGGFF